MQILIAALLIIILIGFIIYKIDGKFEKKEAIILSSLLIISILLFTLYQKNQTEFLPNSFKTEYKKQNNIDILKLSSELLNNKDVSSKSNFIYKFTYIISKNNKEYLCIANKVQINKIEDEFVFAKWNEECKEK